MSTRIRCSERIRQSSSPTKLTRREIQRDRERREVSPYERLRIVRRAQARDSEGHTACTTGDSKDPSRLFTFLRRERLFVGGQLRLIAGNPDFARSVARIA